MSQCYWMRWLGPQTVPVNDSSREVLCGCCCCSFCSCWGCRWLAPWQLASGNWQLVTYRRWQLATGADGVWRGDDECEWLASRHAVNLTRICLAMRLTIYVGNFAYVVHPYPVSHIVSPSPSPSQCLLLYVLLLLFAVFVYVYVDVWMLRCKCGCASLRALLCQDGVAYNSNTQLPDLVWHLNLEAGNWGSFELGSRIRGS